MTDVKATALSLLMIVGALFMVVLIAIDANKADDAQAQTVRDVQWTVRHLIYQRADNGLCFAVAINGDHMRPQYVHALVPSEYCPKAEHP